MLNGIDPIIIFKFYENLLPDEDSNIPLSIFPDQFVTFFVPIYLSEKLTGLFIDTEEKNIDIDTTQNALASGGAPLITQRPLNSTLKVTLNAVKDSIGLILISALADLLLPKVTAKLYDVTYLHGATTIFNGLIHSFAIHQEAGTTLSTVTLEIANTSKFPGLSPKNDATLPLNNSSAAPTNPPPGGGGGARTPVPSGSKPPPLSLG